MGGLNDLLSHQTDGSFVEPSVGKQATKLLLFFIIERAAFSQLRLQDCQTFSGFLARIRLDRGGARRSMTLVRAEAGEFISLRFDWPLDFYSLIVIFVVLEPIIVIVSNSVDLKGVDAGPLTWTLNIGTTVPLLATAGNSRNTQGEVFGVAGQA